MIILVGKEWAARPRRPSRGRLDRRYEELLAPITPYVSRLREHTSTLKLCMLSGYSGVYGIRANLSSVTPFCVRLTQPRNDFPHDIQMPHCVINSFDQIKGANTVTLHHPYLSYSHSPTGMHCGTHQMQNMEDSTNILRSRGHDQHYEIHDRASPDARCLIDKRAAYLESISDVSSKPQSFCHFSRLPPELRRHIWELFCPELALNSRLLDITVAPSSAEHVDASSRLEHGNPWTAKDGRPLDAMTLARRRVLAVNHESRTIALQAFPDYLSLDLTSRTAIVRFNKDIDVVLLTGYGMDYHASEQYYFPQFASKITQLAISSTFGTGSSTADAVDVTMDFVKKFPNLKRVFFLLESVQQNSFRNLQWCVPGLVHESFFNFSRETARGEDDEDHEMVFCWPDLDKHVGPHHPDRKAPYLPLDLLDQKIVDELLSLGVEPLPMALFKYKSGLDLYKRLQERSGKPDANPHLQSELSLSSMTSDEDTSDDEQGVARIYEDSVTDDGESSPGEQVLA